MFEKKHLLLCSLLTTTLMLSACNQNHPNKSLFSLEHYSQKISDWIKPDDMSNHTLLLDTSSQQHYVEKFYNHLYGISSPWSEEYIHKIIKHTHPDDLATLEQSVISEFNNQNKSEDQIGYGENFHPHSQDWIKQIAYNVNSAQFNQLTYNANQRGIAVDNLAVRILPTDDVDFYHEKFAGQGYPFDNLQMSALWAGTPVYILGESRDHAWFMVVSPDFIAWVHQNGIARVNDNFVQTWQFAAKKQLAAIIHTQTPVVDQQGLFRFSAYVGSVFPAEEIQNRYKVMIPITTENKQATIAYATLTKTEASLIPVPATQHNFTVLMNTLIGRPYGWGNMYFYNDCSAELKNLLTPFGIWLPRHSSDQLSIGKMIDKTQNTAEERLNYLMEHGHRFMTLVYIGGHIVLYIGNYPNPNTKDHPLMAMTYQNLWGLHPTPATSRFIIGKAVLFPMLLHYPENKNIESLAARKVFQLSFLDEPANDLNLIQIIDLKSLMFP